MRRAALIAVLALAACAPAVEAPGPQTVMIERWAASAGDPASLDPAKAIYTLPQGAIPYAIFDQLTTYDPEQGKVVPMLAEFSSNAAATVWTFRMRKDATWHDGAPVRPSDVKFAWERVVAPKTASRAAALFSSIEGYEAARKGAGGLSGVLADDAAGVLTVRLSEPFADFAGLVTQLPFSPVPAHVVGGLAPGARWDDGAMVGSGPFRMAAPWAHNRSIRLARFDGYYGPKAGLAGIEFRVGKDVDASYTEFDAGVAHIAFVPPNRYDEIRARRDVRLIDEPMSATWYLGFNMKDPVVGGPANRPLREAISYALNRKAIVEAVYQGGRRVGYTLTPPETPGYDASAAPVRGQDIARAKALLAGRAKAPVRIIYNVGSGQENVLALVKSDLEAVGVPVSVRGFDSAQFPGEISKPGTMVFRQLATFTYPSPDAGLYPLLHSKAAGTNLTHYANPAVDALLDQARGTPDAAARGALYARAEAMALADFPVIPVFQYKAAGVAQTRLAGVRFMPSGYMNYARARFE